MDLGHVGWGSCESSVSKMGGGPGGGGGGGGGEERHDPLVRTDLIDVGDATGPVLLQVRPVV